MEHKNNQLRFLKLSALFVFFIACTPLEITDVPPFSPTAQFTSQVDASNSLMVSFTSKTTNAMAYNWDFGDGNTSEESDPSHTYIEGGEYTVTLTVTGEEDSTPAIVTGTVNVVAESLDKLAGTIIGHDGSWDGVNGLIDTAVDGDLSTFVDAPGAFASTGFVGYDFGSGNSANLKSVKFAPRDGWASRMVNGEIRGSNDPTFAVYDILYTIGSEPANGELTEVSITNLNNYRFIYYYTAPDGYCNIAELEFYGELLAIPGGKIQGAIIGHEGSWDGVNGLVDTAADGDLSTFVDAPSEFASTGYVGYDVGVGYQVVVSSVKFAPRDGFPSRLVNGEIRGSNDPDLGSYDVLYTITEEPTIGMLTEASISSSTAYRYVYYYTAPDGYCNIAELEVYGTISQSN